MRKGNQDVDTKATQVLELSDKDVKSSHYKNASKAIMGIFETNEKQPYEIENIIKWKFQS